jgi:hypothetical protein
MNLNLLPVEEAAVVATMSQAWVDNQCMIRMIYFNQSFAEEGFVEPESVLLLIINLFKKRGAVLKSG